MRRVLLLATIIATLVAASLAGCTPQQKTSAGGAVPAAASPPAVGTNPLLPASPGIFQPEAAAVLGGEIASVGYIFADPFSGKFVPGVASLAGGKDVRFEKIGTDERVVKCATDVGRIRVVAGRSLPSGRVGQGQVPFIATSDNGGAFQIHELGQLFGGRSADLIGIASTGSASDSHPTLMAVGAAGRSSEDDVGVVTRTDPIAIVSADSGKTWSMAAALPLPTGVTGAEALSVTRAPSGTAFPGVLVVGGGWTDTTATGAREVTIVWQTQDEGKTWKVVSDDSFAQAGHDYWPQFVAADANTVIIAGWTDSVGNIAPDSAPTRSEDLEWVAGKDGTWQVVTDGDLLPPSRSGVTTALIARPGGGFLWAGETFDTTAGGAFRPGQDVKGNPSIWLFTTPDGGKWTRFDTTVPGIDQAAIVVGIAESGNRTAFFGVDQHSEEQAWVVDSASIK